MKKQTETQLVKTCLEWLHIMGIFAWRNNTGAFAREDKGRRRFVRYGEKGSADIIGVGKQGRFLSVECKLPGRRQTPDQVAFQKKIEDNGGWYYLVHDLDELRSFFEDP